ncbi:MAG: Smr/MutS family protein [Cytophagaceae bacterium]|jgi:DNA mismatch repair protein MutS2|nr:Smr/MutS family protein [Cytophagaceae bacterium]
MFKPGDLVAIKGRKEVGTILSIQGKQAEVAFAMLKLRVSISDLEVVTEDELEEEETSSTPFNTSIDTKERMLHFQFELDLRGKMKDEVLVLLTSWMDDALLLGVEKATIIHGRGTGVIKDTVRNFIRQYKEADILHDPSLRNADSITIVRFKK